ncbi:DUF1376 domain-containing protein [Phyllobacterium pellucidum]|uniref:DUF1376 domain-containing protein n=1 Tax=Phyllobacterium pellucidum TaxID=2740464 RepID=UPI001D15CC63|nr:DUF1376 domain-containing protein [Phyllobacterium sp. T1018]UGY08653.1 YdaU family protein [Phyllobacterium sp. T1018]
MPETAKPKAPAYIRFFASDWLAGTRGLTMPQTGIYITLVAMMYERGEPLDADVEQLALHCLTTKKSFVGMLEKLVSLGKIIRLEDGSLWNRKVASELDWSRKKSNVQAANADSRWQGKRNKNNGASMPSQSHGNANGMHRARVPEPEPEPEPEREEKRTPDGVPKKQDFASRLPENFEPDLAFANSYGLSDGEAEVEAAKFKDHWRAQPGKDGVKQDWLAMWRNWVRNIRRQQAPRSANVNWRDD